MTIALLGIMGAFAITALGDHTEAVINTRDQRNAQEVASVFSAAHAAGLNFVADNQLEATVRRILQGGSPKSGAFAGRVFRVSLVGESDIAGAMKYLALQNGQLIYHHDS
ncbi:MAG: hypothetical protein K1X78_26275 [Verrucomicrobiaceae bacterium]|nr:hypothetical protein [Verrucomicrobiaceae bacterium]